MTLRYSHLAPAHKAAAVHKLADAFKAVQTAPSNAEAVNSQEPRSAAERSAQNRHIYLVRRGRGLVGLDEKPLIRSNLQDSNLVEAGGIEPPSESLPSPRLHA